MKASCVFAFLANLAVLLLSLAVWPARVAVHFDGAGVPNGWASKEAHALMMTVLLGLLFALLYASGRLTTRLPARWVNLPHKDYWLHPGRLAETRARLERFLWPFGTALFAFLLVLNLLVLEANRRQPARLDPRAFFPALVLFLLFTAGWAIAFQRAFRPPAPPAPRAGGRPA